MPTVPARDKASLTVPVSYVWCSWAESSPLPTKAPPKAPPGQKARALSGFRRSLHRFTRTTLLPLLLMGFLAAIALAPLAYYQMPDSPGQDLATHVAGIIEAKNALEEGQFPIRIAPYQNDKARYPIFQYYGNLPYTAGGLLHRCLSMDPYAAWKLVIGIALTLGGYFTYRSGRLLTRQLLPALVAGAVFVTAPYILTDIHARVAYPETVSFGLLPAVFYYSMRCFQGRRLVHLLGAGAAWSAVGLSHNITFLYASLFFGAFFCSMVRPNRRFAGSITRVGCAYGLGLLLNAWYLAPQFATLPMLAISDMEWSVYAQNWLTPLNILLAPGLVVPTPNPVPLDNPHLGLQCGWPILGAVALACYYAGGGITLSPRQRGWLVRPLVLLAVALFMVWSPVDFWQYLPRAFSFVQFSYRLLMFVVFWGALLAGAVLAHTCRKGGLRPVAFVGCLGVLGFTAAPYLSVAHRFTDQVSVAGLIRQPSMGLWAATEVYKLHATGPVDTLRPLLATAQAPALIPQTQLRATTYFARKTECFYRASAPCVAQLPIHYYPGLQRVGDNGEMIAAGSLDGYLAVPLAPGEHHLEVRFVGTSWANTLSAAAWVFLLVGLASRLLLPLAAGLVGSWRLSLTPAAVGQRRWSAAWLGATCGGLVAATLLLRATVCAPPLIASVTASSVMNPLCEAEYVVDGKELTAWAAATGDPASLHLRLRRTVPLHSLELLSRGTNLYEGWHDVKVRLYRREQLIFEQQYSFEDASTRRLEVARFPATPTDHIELLLSRPVTVSPWGKPANRPVNPGYAEIRLGYDP